jgi:hypothetical protein
MDPYSKLDRRALLKVGLGTAALGVAAALPGCNARVGEGESFSAGRVRGSLPSREPGSFPWRRTEALRVPLMAQRMIAPNLHEATVDDVVVRALYDGQQLAVQAEWADPHRDEAESTAQFRDSLAVMLPLDPAAGVPPVVMGAAGMPVYILHWKASWQVDHESGFRDVEKTYPRWFNDVYPGHRDMIAKGWDDEATHAYYLGRAARNPLSERDRRTCVEELVAEGFGTLTTRAQQSAQGRGVHGRRGWRVAMEIPPASRGGPRLQPGATVPIAFAVWEGSERQVGGRKHYTNWVNLHLPGDGA